MVNNNWILWKRIIYLLILLAAVSCVSYILARYLFPVEIIEKSFLGLRETVSYEINHRLIWLLLVITWIITISVWYVNFFTNIFKQIRIYFHNRSFVIKRIIAFTLVNISLGSFIAGLFSPLYYSEQFILYKTEVSLLDSIQLLYEHQEIYLAILVAVFTLAFPILKFLLIFIMLIFSEQRTINRLRKWVETIGKWSMLDVFIISILLINMKFGSKLMDMELRQGITWFSISIILIMIVFTIIPGNKEKIIFQQRI